MCVWCVCVRLECFRASKPFAALETLSDLKKGIFRSPNLKSLEFMSIRKFVFYFPPPPRRYSEQIKTNNNYPKVLLNIFQVCTEVGDRDYRKGLHVLTMLQAICRNKSAILYILTQE